MFCPWLLAFGFLFAFLDAYGIGANDVANSFATSVASKTLTYKQAVIIAVFTEFLGALLLGSNVASTIQKNIIDVSLFQDSPGELMLGMVCALIGSSSWVLTATRLGMPVSTTHSIIGAIMGVGIAARGTEAVDWGTWDSGFASIALSWVISPILSGVIAFLFYTFTKHLILKSPNSLQRAYVLIPLYLAGTLSVILFFMVYKGAPGLKLDQVDSNIVGGAVGGVCAFSLIVGYIVVVPLIKKRFDEESRQLMDTKESDADLNIDFNHIHSENPNGTSSHSDGEPVKLETVDKDKEEVPAPTGLRGIVHYVVSWFQNGLNQDVVSNKGDPKLVQMHDRVVKYENKTERLYSILQVLTACFASFAHGSNDVANAVGPFTTVFFIADNGYVNTKKMDIPIWILVYCAVALDLGLLTWGYRIMRSLGNKITFHSPSRGFVMELSATLTVLTATKLGLPVSTTHCITGATAGVGLTDGDIHAVNWRHLAIVFFGWIITVPSAGLVAGLIFSLFAFAPKHNE